MAQKPRGGVPAPRPRLPRPARWPYLAAGGGLLVLGAGLLAYIEWTAQPGTPEANRRPPLPQVAAKPGTSAAVAPDVAPGPGPLTAAQASSSAAPLEEDPVPAKWRLPVGPPEAAAQRLKEVLDCLETGSLEEKRGAQAALFAMGDAARPLLGPAVHLASRDTLPCLARACAEVKATEAVAALIGRVEKEGSLAGDAVFTALGELATPEARQFLRSRLKDGDPAVRQFCWKGLALCAEAGDLPALKEKLGDGPGLERDEAVRGLARLGASPDMQAAIRQLCEQALATPGVDRLPYAQALSLMPPAPFEHLLVRLTLDEDPAIRTLAMQGLSRDERTASRVVTQLAHESDDGVVTTCVRALTERPQYDAVRRLLELLVAESLEHRGLARQALSAAFEVDMGPLPAAWQYWLDEGAKEGDPERSNAFRACQEARARKARGE